MSAHSSPHKDEAGDLPVAFPPLSGSDIEIRRYKKKEDVLRQILLSEFGHRDKVGADELKKFLAGRLPEGAALNSALFEELFRSCRSDSAVSMYPTHADIGRKGFVETFLQQEKVLEAEIEQKVNLTFDHQKMRTAARTKLEQAKVSSCSSPVPVGNREAQCGRHHVRQCSSGEAGTRGRCLGEASWEADCGSVERPGHPRPEQRLLPGTAEQGHDQRRVAAVSPLREKRVE